MSDVTIKITIGSKSNNDPMVILEATSVLRGHKEIGVPLSTCIAILLRHFLETYNLST
jgi:hypothetical protein